MKKQIEIKEKNTKMDYLMLPRQTKHLDRVYVLINCLLEDWYKLGECNKWINDSMYGYDVTNRIRESIELKSELQWLKSHKNFLEFCINEETNTNDLEYNNYGR